MVISLGFVLIFNDTHETYKKFQFYNYITFSRDWAEKSFISTFLAQFNYHLESNYYIPDTELRFWVTYASIYGKMLNLPLRSRQQILYIYDKFTIIEPLN